MTKINCLDITGIEQKDYQLLYYLASPERKNRTDQYPRHQDKLRCIAADALLRRAVKLTSGVSLFSVGREEDGKPFVEGLTDFHYNISHSGRWVVIAYGSEPVGIDVQKTDFGTGKEAIARRHFTADEQEALFSVAGDDRVRRFFQIWTKKESYLKHLGTGLRRSLDSFSVMPDQAPSGVHFYTTFLDDHCLSLCSRDTEVSLRILDLRQLLCVKRNFR